MKTVTIGRSTSNNCVLANPSVSGRHAELALASDGKQATLRDLGSTNGTFVNGRRLQPGEMVTVTVTDRLRFGSEDTTLSSIIAMASKTVVLSGPGIGTGTDRRTIGKAADNNIVMNYDDVSRHHAVLYRDAQGNVVIEDVGSTNGTFVNGIRVVSQVLHAGDKVCITRNHTLNWENLFSPPKPKPNAPNGKGKLLPRIAIAIAVALIACIVGFMIWNATTWDKERIYKEYHTAVCWVYVQYGYKVMLDGEDITSSLFQLCGRTNETGIIAVDADGRFTAEPMGSQGTAFFISNDGKLATNLHVARPWLYNGDMSKIEEFTNDVLSSLVALNPAYVAKYSHAKLEVKPFIYVYIVPDGLPLASDNLVECEVIATSDNTDIDVALLQTMSRSLPPKVTQIIDINKADISPESIVEGKTVFTIGYPYGMGINLNSKKELHNQIHDGSVTQDRGEYDFAHDAEAAGGASGSPIINDRGRLIGIHHAGMTGVTGAQGFSQAIKAKYIKQLFDK